MLVFGGARIAMQVYKWFEDGVWQPDPLILMIAPVRPGYRAVDLAFTIVMTSLLIGAGAGSRHDRVLLKPDVEHVEIVSDRTAHTDKGRRVRAVFASPALKRLDRPVYVLGRDIFIREPADLTRGLRAFGYTE